MGKSKQKRFKVHQANPTGLPSVKEFDQEVEENSDSIPALQPIIEQLSSINEETRECGCAALANLVASTENIKTLLQKDCIKVLAPLFLDSSPQVSVKALGAVRNITVDGGLHACEVLIQKDVLTPLVALFTKFDIGWKPSDVQSKKLGDLKQAILTEATHILWNLCEASEDAVKIFNKENLVEILWPCLQYNVYGYGVAITVAQCLQTVTEDNKDLKEICRQQDKCQILEAIIADGTSSSQHALLKTLAVGILTNVVDDLISANLLDVVIQTLSQVLMVNAVEVLNTELQTRVTAAGDNNLDQLQTDFNGDTTDNVVNLLKAQQTALEIVTNICCVEDEWEELDSSESSSDEMTVDMEMDESANVSPESIPEELQNAITSNQVFTKVLQKIEPVDILPLLEGSSCRNRILKNFEQLQIYALLCCSNIVGTLHIGCLGGQENLHNVWAGLVKLSSTDTVARNLSLLEGVTSCMRAVVQRLSDVQSPKLLEVTPQDLQYLYEIEQKSSLPDIKVNVVRIVATIGCVYAKIPEPHPFLKDVGTFLLEVCCKEEDLRVIAEALDAIFDVFGEDHLDPIVREIQMISRLNLLLPNLKKQIQSKKRQLGEHYPVISTARLNLIRFIKYKSS